VDYSDPHVPVALPVRKHELKMDSVELTPRSLGQYDAVLVATAHKAFDFGLVAKHSKLVVDSRNAMAPWAAEMGPRLVKA
jgi:UDP-N-acetyl-D-glucosamine dehydrogenase